MSKSVRRRVAGAAALALTLVGAFGPAAQAAPTPEQLVFEQPFLAAFEPGASISYRFSRVAADVNLAPSFEDVVTLNVVKPDDARDGDKAAVVRLFSGPKARSFGPMPATYNPVVLVLLEQDVVEMQKVLGGSPYYIRARIRDALTSAEKVDEVKVDYKGQSIDAWSIKVSPFVKDPNRAKLKDFADRTYEITFSDKVPGGLYAIHTVTPKAGATTPLLVETLTVTGEGETGAKP